MKIEAILGFCARAGKLKSGDFAVEKAVKSGLARCVVLDASVSDNTSERWQTTCSHTGTPLVYIEEAGKHVGKPDKKIFAITDEGFMTLLQNALDGNNSDNK